MRTRLVLAGEQPPVVTLAPYTLNPKPSTLDPKPQTLNLESTASNPESGAPNSAMHPPAGVMGNATRPRALACATASSSGSLAR